MESVNFNLNFSIYDFLNGKSHGLSPWREHVNTAILNHHFKSVTVDSYTYQQMKFARHKLGLK